MSGNLKLGHCKIQRFPEDIVDDPIGEARKLVVEGEFFKAVRIYRLNVFKDGENTDPRVYQMLSIFNLVSAKGAVAWLKALDSPTAGLAGVFQLQKIASADCLKMFDELIAIDNRESDNDRRDYVEEMSRYVSKGKLDEAINSFYSFLKTNSVAKCPEIFQAQTLLMCAVNQKLKEMYDYLRVISSSLMMFRNINECYLVGDVTDGARLFREN